MSLAKLIALVILGSAIHVSTTPPNPPIPKQKRRLSEGIIDVHISTYVLKSAYWVHALIEAIIVVGAHCFPHSEHYKQMVQYLLPHGDQSTIFLSPAAAAGCILGALSGIGRYLCYRTLGRHYTFHVTLLKDHKLATTGPYSLVRHPGYSTGLLLFPAMLIYYTAPGSWLRESRVCESAKAWVVLCPILIAGASLSVGNSFLRLNVEDEILRKEFGKEWEEWASRVRYKLIPGVY